VFGGEFGANLYAASATLDRGYAALISTRQHARREYIRPQIAFPLAFPRLCNFIFVLRTRYLAYAYKSPHGPRKNKKLVAIPSFESNSQTVKCLGRLCSESPLGTKFLALGEHKNDFHVGFHINTMPAGGLLLYLAEENHILDLCHWEIRRKVLAAP